MADESEGAGDVQRAEDRPADQRDVPQPPVSRERVPAVATQSLGGQALLLFPETTLGRPFAGGNQPVEFFNIVEPGKMYGDRLNNVDLRIGKNLKYGRHPHVGGARYLQYHQLQYDGRVPDGLFTDAPRPAAQYLNPLSITQARLFKISVQFDF